MSHQDSNGGRTVLSRRSALKLGLGTAASLTLFGLDAKIVMAQEGRVLKVIHPSIDLDWSPLRGGGNYYRWNSLWWASPMYFDGKGDIQPYVFASWNGSKDSKIWTFKIDPKAQFSDGSKIVAASVKGSFELASMPTTKHQRIEQVLSGVEGFADISAGKGQEMPGLIAVDDATLEVHLTEPDPIFFMRLANHLVPIIKPEIARDDTGQEVPGWWDAANSPVVSGPFKPTMMNLDAGELAFEPNENFFGPKPKLARVEIRSVEDPVVAVNLIKTGEYQAHSVIVTPTLIQDLGKEFVEGPIIPKGQHFWFAFNREPTNDPKVRQALIMAVDRDGLMQASFPDGPHIKAEQVLNAVPGVDDQWQPYPYDPEGAKKALAESSYGGPERLPKLMMVGISTPAYEAAAQYIAEQWRQNLGITAVDMKPQIDSYAGPDQSGVQIFRDDVGTRVPDAVIYLVGSIQSDSSNAKNKLGGYKNDEIDKLLEQAAQIATDDPKRIELARQAQRLFRDDYPFIPWLYEAMSRWARKEVVGIDKNLDWQVVEPWNLDLTA